MTTIIDNAIDSQLCWSAYANFPSLSWDGWHHYSDEHAEKYGQKDSAQIPDAYTACLLQMIDRANQVVGPNCFPDLSLYGAGLHRMEQGGFLRRHLDASLHAIHGWKREWSVILYLNPTWEESDAGKFGMTFSLDPECKDAEAVWHQPIFNRMTMFRTHERSRHEVEQYKGIAPRLSLALFYFSLDEPRKPLRHKAQFDPV